MMRMVRSSGLPLQMVSLSFIRKSTNGSVWDISARQFCIPDRGGYHRGRSCRKVFSVFGYDNHADNYNTAVEASGANFRFKQVTDIINDKAKRYEFCRRPRSLYTQNPVKTSKRLIK